MRRPEMQLGRDFYVYTPEGESYSLQALGHDPAPETDVNCDVHDDSLLVHPIWDELIETVTPVSEIRTYRMQRAVRRHYEQLARFREGLLPIGDSVCFFNPTHGQGMSSAAGQCRGPESLLDDRASTGAGLDGLATDFFPIAADWVRGPWILAAMGDFAHPGCTGDFPADDLPAPYGAKVPDITYDRYPTFSELTSWLEAFADEFPDLVHLTSIGTSYEGRDLWLLTVTNHALGTPGEKPAMWIDGNIHASEVTATVAIVHLVDQLTSGFGSDADITRALDTRVFYLVPRVNPDGAELALAELPTLVRGSVHPWPFTEQRPGLVDEDVDHDGRILQMRVEDPNGAWKPYPNDARLMVAREPDEDGDGPYYRLLAEGTIHDYDGVQVPTAPFQQGIDPNRQFPYRWERKVEGPWDAGEFPGSEPEIAALLQAVTERKNICAYFAYHTFSGVHIRPYSDQDDDAFGADDLWTYEVLGEMATELTGYESISGYHDFRYHPKSVIRGVGTDWAFDHLGVYSWTTEFWSALQAAGLDDAHPLEWYRTHPLDEELQLLAWVDENVPGGYVDWYEFDHPQLGRVELGGWHSELVFRNPPPHLLEAEVEPHSRLATRIALSSPLLRHRDTVVERLDDGTWRVRVVVENAGWMKTAVTDRAVASGYVRPMVARITLPDGASLATGTERLELGQLGGRALKQNAVRSFSDSSDGTDDRTVAEWIVRAPIGSSCEVEVAHDRAGTVRTTVPLG